MSGSDEEILTVANCSLEVPMLVEADQMIGQQIAKIVMWVTAVLGLLGNSLLLGVFSQRGAVKVHDILIGTLALLDLLHCLINIVVNWVPVEVQRRLLGPQVSCVVSHSLYNFVSLSSFLTIIDITLERLLAVCRVMFHRVHVTNSRTLCLLLSTQLLLLLIMSPTGAICFTGTPSLSSIASCFPTVSPKHQKRQYSKTPAICSPKVATFLHDLAGRFYE